MPPKKRFADGEKILCFQGPLLYKATCLKSMVTAENLVKYYVHYVGWNKKWNEWVEETRVLEYSEANIAEQDEIQATVSAEIKGRKGWGRKSDKDAFSPTAATATEVSDSGKHALVVAANTDSAPKPNKRKHRHPKVEIEEPYFFNTDIKIPLPDVVKSWLVNDWYKVTTKFQVVCVPAKVSVDEILDRYLMHKTLTNNNICNGTLDEELVKALKVYFNMTLEQQVLYDLELPQYQKIKHENPKVHMSSIYGAIHLLRLLSKLEVLLTYVHLDQKAIAILKSAVEDFLKYFVQNSSSFFG